MAKTNDQFEKFKAATLGDSPKLSDAISRTVAPSVQEPLPAKRSAHSEEPQKNNLIKTCVYIDKDLRKKLNHLKADSGKSLIDLYNEAVELLLKKNKIL